MKTSGAREEYDIVIIGAGPAGCSAALAAAGSGLRVAVLEKATFPRDKVCGDAIPGRAITTLAGIDPTLAAAFGNFHAKYVTRHSTLYYKKYSLMFDWVLDAYTCTRMEFDNFLFSQVQQTSAELLCGTRPVSIQRRAEGMVVATSDGRVLHAKVIIGADGAHSFTAKQLAPRPIDRTHYVASVRAYFSGIKGLDENTVEMYFDEKYLPSYLWVFPVHGGRANVGLGVLSSEVAKKKMNIRQAFYEFIDRVPVLKEKMSCAVRHGELEGFGLPLGSNIGSLSGDRFMLCGDAAALIDPVTGDGIGNAMLSGKLAAEQAIRCSRQKNFSASFMLEYDRQLLGRLQKELRTHYYAQRALANIPFLLDAFFFAGKSPLLKRAIKKWL